MFVWFCSQLTSPSSSCLLRSLRQKPAGQFLLVSPVLPLFYVLCHQFVHFSFIKLHFTSPFHLAVENWGFAVLLIPFWCCMPPVFLLLLGCVFVFLVFLSSCVLHCFSLFPLLSGSPKLVFRIQWTVIFASSTPSSCFSVFFLSLVLPLARRWGWLHLSQMAQMLVVHKVRNKNWAGKSG